MKNTVVQSRFVKPSTLVQGDTLLWWDNTQPRFGKFLRMDNPDYRTYPLRVVIYVAAATTTWHAHFVADPSGFVQKVINPDVLSVADLASNGIKT